MKVTVCIGSSCHIKGSRQVVERLQHLIAQEKLGDRVELGGTFCMGNCVNRYNFYYCTAYDYSSGKAR